jgi:hypothetical protein
MMCTECGSWKLENYTLKLCATCNKQRLKTSKPTTAKKPKAVKRISEKHKATLASEQAFFKAMDSEGIKWCESCGDSAKPLTRSHIIPKGMYPQFRLTRENLMYECYECHFTWEHGSITEKQQLQSYEHKIEVIKKLCSEYLHKLINKR